MKKVSKEDVKEGIEEVKDWCADHKKLLAGAGIVSFIFFRAVFPKKTGTSLDKKIEDIPIETAKDFARKVDEDIFVTLAPDIKTAVLNEGIDKVILDRIYNIGNGYHKYVKVNIKTVYGE